MKGRRCALLLDVLGGRHGVTALRLATAAPDGMRGRGSSVASDGIVAGDQGALRIKWYFGGIAGDEMETIDRMAKGQLDGVASGGPCSKGSPRPYACSACRAVPEPRRGRLRDARAATGLTDGAEKAGFALLVAAAGADGVAARRR